MFGIRGISAIAGIAFLALSSTAGAQGTAPAQPAPAGSAAKPEAELVSQIGHGSVVQAVAFSPDGRLVVSAGGETLRMWDFDSGRLVRSFPGHKDGVADVTFSPDGRLLLSGGDDATMRLWDVMTGAELRSFKAEKTYGGIDAIAFSPDGRFVLCGFEQSSMATDGSFKTLREGMIILWDAATGQELRRFTGHSHKVTSLAFSPDGRFVLSGSSARFALDEEKAKPKPGEAMKLWDAASGKELRGFGAPGDVNSVAFSPDGSLALSGADDQVMRLWDVATGKELRSFTGQGGSVTSVAFSPDGRFALSGNSYDRLMSPDREIGFSSADNVKLWDVSTGQRVRSFDIPNRTIANVHGRIVQNPTHAAFSSDGRHVLSDSGGSIGTWDTETGKFLGYFMGLTSRVSAVAFSPDGRQVLTESARTLTLWDVATGRSLRNFGESSWGVAVTFSPDGRFIVSATHGDFEKQKLMDPPARKAVAYSPDGRSLLIANGWSATVWEAATGQKLREFSETAGQDKADNPVTLWDVESGKELRRFSGHTEEVTSVAVSPDGRFALSGGRDLTMRLWDISTGQEVRKFGVRGSTFIYQGVEVAFSPDGRMAVSGTSSEVVIWEVATGKELYGVGLSGFVTAMAFSPSGRLLLIDGAESRNPDDKPEQTDNKTLLLIDIVERQVLRQFTGHTDEITFVGFSRDDRLAISGSGDGTARIWRMEDQKELARLVTGPDNEWLALTPQGFFSSAYRDTAMLSIVRGLDVTTIGQVHQSLFNPDLVREALAGDTGGEVARAAGIINLEKVLDSGPPPQAAITSHPQGSRSQTDLVKVTARITDRGKGIGRIEWRVNGITAGVMSVPAGEAGTSHDVEQTLALDPGDNQIEVIAYERLNLLASAPARTTIVFDGPADNAKPTLHILAIGVNAYVDRGWTPPGATEKVLFPPLNLAVADAKAFAAGMRQAGEGYYGDIRVTAALDGDARADNLDRLADLISTQVAPRDTFVLYAAAHGISKDGRFYMIPQDFQGGDDPAALAKRAISQENLQDWVANRIKAKKVLILLDTCESGALVSGYTRSRTDAPASEAAIGRLHEATGRPVLTAAASGKPAFEGYQGHGVFTYALLDALHNGDTSGNGIIELSELVTHVQGLVPKLSAKVAGGEATKGAAMVAMRGFRDDKQSAHFGSTGEDFPLVRRLP